MSMRKGEMTRAAILDVALELASRDGLEGLTIGLLADRMNMSKSGVFAHFGSREDLQIDVLKLYHRRFEQEVFFPSLTEPRGLQRLEAMFNRWLKRVSVEIASGCIYISGAVEYDDRPGPIREALVAMVRAWQGALVRCAQQAIDGWPGVGPTVLVHEVACWWPKEADQTPPLKGVTSGGSPRTRSDPPPVRAWPAR